MAETILYLSMVRWWKRVISGGGLVVCLLIEMLFAIQHVEAAPVRGVAGDLWADVVLGQQDFTETAPFQTVNHKLFWGYGVIVDRTANPNKMYVYDSGNNRVLGFDLGKCLAAPPGSFNCQAEVVLGQPSMSRSACNGDAGFQNYPTRAPATASSLCGQWEGQLSISEGGSGSSMAVDAEGNLYVTDFFNHRVLKYQKPYENSQRAGQAAVEVWGQNNFTGNLCNKGQTTRNAQSLCFSWGNSNNWTAGVDIDAQGNLWVVDSGNNRVLRFPKNSTTGVIAKTADLVLGQNTFTTAAAGTSLNQLEDPSVVRMSKKGWMYVLDYKNQRILVFKPPFTSGMTGELFSSALVRPSGIDIDPVRTGIWITDGQKQTVELWNEDTKAVTKTLRLDNERDTMGSVGIDASGNVFVTKGGGDYRYDIYVFKPDVSSSVYQRLLGTNRVGNMVTNADMASVGGIAIVNNQLIVSDYGRMLYWNNLETLTNGKPASGSLNDSPNGIDFSCCHDLRADKTNTLWVTFLGQADKRSRISAYSLPISTASQPFATVNFPVPILGGGEINLDNPTQFIQGMIPSDDGNFLWVSLMHRVFRVRNPKTNPVVDIILGQTNSTGNLCNRGGMATPNSLCFPGRLAFDKQGNLFVSDHSLEIQGNMRLLVFNKALFPANPASVVYAPTPSKIFPAIATWQPAFDSQNRMLVGYNPYWTANMEWRWFPGFYTQPLSAQVAPDALLKDYYSMAVSAEFDQNDDLYVTDLNRGRVLIYRRPFAQLTPSPTLSPTSTVRPTATSTPIPINFKRYLPVWFTSQLDGNQDNVFNVLDWLNIFR